VAEICLAKPYRRLDQGLKHRPKIEGRAADDFEHVTRRCLVSERLLEIASALPQLAKEPRVLHRDHRLDGEILQQCDLLFGERAHLLPVDREAAEQDIVFAQGHDQNCAKPAQIDRSAVQRVAGFDFRKIGKMNQRFDLADPRRSSPRVDP
jgi:hypothetical protein